jgi:hypothetical protein
MLSIDRKELDAAIACITNQHAARFQEIAGQRVDTSLTYANEDSPAALVTSDDPDWAELEYGTFRVEPDPWATTTLMEMSIG